jgi:1-acyl-sn-glycerol-3-phosphate acyltransferase
LTGWNSAPPPVRRIGLGGYARFVWRALTIGLLTYGGLLILLVLRLVEIPLYGVARPWTPTITRLVCRAALAVMGLPLVVHGTPMTEAGATVSNHSSWLDVLVLNATHDLFFVAKAEVANWPVINWLARATGTVFITRKGGEIKRQKAVFEDRLQAGHRLLFFPEGTSTDAIRVLPFKSSLFEAFYAPGLRASMHIQPVTVVFHAPEGEDPRFYGWWGDMDFGSHFLHMLAARRHGRVEVTFHPQVPVDAFDSRKTLALHCERVIRTAHVNAEA